jgi:hypothetical protein
MASDAAEAKPGDGQGDQASASGDDNKRVSFSEMESRRSSVGSPESLAQRTRKAWLKNCRRIFDEFDADGGGSIDIAEFEDLLEQSGLHFSAQDIERICNEFDANGDGEIDFEEFTSFLEAHGMGPGKGGTTMQMTDALRMIKTSIKENTLDISDKEREKVESSVAAVCPKNHALEKVSIGELALERFYFGLGGFICFKCDIHSDNMVNKAAYLCQECQYVACTICASLSRQKRIEMEIQKRTSTRMEGLSSQRKSLVNAAARGQKVVRRGRKKGGNIRFDGGGVRMSLPSIDDPGDPSGS